MHSTEATERKRIETPRQTEATLFCSWNHPGKPSLCPKPAAVLPVFAGRRATSQAFSPPRLHCGFSDQRTRLPSSTRPSPWAPGSSPVGLSPSHPFLRAPGWGLEPACGGAEDKASIQIADGNREALCPPHGPHLFPSGVWRSSWALELGLPGLILLRKGSSERCPTLEFFKGVGEKHRGAFSHRLEHPVKGPRLAAAPPRCPSSREGPGWKNTELGLRDQVPRVIMSLQAILGNWEEKPKRDPE
ncbi:uncharacterized protein LOC121023786 [Herpailurus yagouaroundi]|uniref:uncharacterized protein LOC121023786 n=1 Tax=Herpailurus yagouaroundi TaxID=1608482 RepID=UPI001AD7DDBC|nr:uncharacterized protein LOC121023786 [Puma yagouaroundi]